MVAAFLIACERASPAVSVSLPPIVEHLFDLQFMDAPELPTLSALVASRADGKGFAVAASSRPLGILLFDGEGRFTGIHSRRGEGPGEIAGVGGIVFDREHNLWVFGDRRVDLWDDSLVHLRSLTLPLAVRSAVPAPDGGTMVVGTDPHDTRVRVRHLSADGVLTPLEIEGDASVHGDPGSEYRSVALVDESSVWVAMFHRYEMRRLDRRTGDTLQRVRDNPDWWKSGAGLDDLAGLMDQSPAILSVGVGPGDALWTLSGIPVPDTDAVHAFHAGNPSAITRLVDHVIRVHDGETGRVLCEHRAEYLPLQFLAGDRAAAAVPAGDSVKVSVMGLRSCDGPGGGPSDDS